ncbi:MAG: phosphatase PAP2 family protein [Melioribacteraceae bacterium]
MPKFLSAGVKKCRSILPSKALVILLLAASTLFAQNDYTLRQFKNESVDFINQPGKWEGSDWLKIGLAGAATFLVMQADQTVRDDFMKDRGFVQSFPIEVGRLYGELYTPFVIAGAFGLNGILGNDKSSKKIGYEIIQTTIYAGAITTALKLAFGRARPFTEKGTNSFGGWSLFDDSFHSLPSGHATIAFSISTVLAKNASSDLVKVICYIPAVLTAISRVYQDKHWASDVFLGGLIGYSVGSWVTSKHDENSIFQATSPQQFSIVIPLN